MSLPKVLRLDLTFKRNFMAVLRAVKALGAVPSAFLFRQLLPFFPFFLFRVPRLFIPAFWFLPSSLGFFSRR